MKLSTLYAATLVATAIFGANAAYAQNASALAKSMQDAYKNVTSYSQKTSASGKISVGAKSQVSGMTAEVRYKKPNMAYIVVSSPLTGTLAAFNTGTGLTVYRSKQNLVNKYPAGDSLKSVVGNLAQFGVVASLDPLYMLEGNTLDPFVASWSTKGTAMINGVKCTVLVGSMKAVALQKAKSGTVTFWIDPAFMAHKVVIEWKGNKIMARPQPTAKNPNPKVQELFFDRSVTETVQEFKVNPNIPEGEFSYPIPKDAREQPTAAPKKK
ncbi:MAG: DUF2092 domain-containing protein [Chthonomonadales bacterium]